MVAARKRKGSNFAGSRKLLPCTKVEVRSVEEGFLGSWHSATVISAGIFTRKVRYDSLMLDDGSDNLTDCVEVSAIIDGENDVEGTLAGYRGTIRPLPPSLEMNQWSLHYGQCVDMHDNGVWWEGVVFDHEDGSEERRIFFPDLGDELKVHIGSLRITQDWDEVSDIWKQRGNWVFLELIEEIEQNCPLLVSVKQIWYDVRVKHVGDLKDWTSADRDKWKNLVLQVWCDNLKITTKHILYEFNSDVLVQEGKTLLELSEPTLDSIVTPEAFFGNSFPIVPFLSRNQFNSHQLASPFISGVQEALPAPSTSQSRPADVVQLSCKRNCKKVPTKLTKRIQRLKWLPVPTDELPEPDLNLDAVFSYCGDSSKPQKSLIPKVKGHIISLGWEIEFAKDIPADRLRYISPEGTSYHSLREVCRILKSKSESQIPNPEDEQGILPLNCDGDRQSLLLVEPTAPKCPSVQDEFISSPEGSFTKMAKRTPTAPRCPSLQDGFVSSREGSFTKTTKRTPTREWQPMALDKLPEPQLHHDAVASYCARSSKIESRESLRSKVRSHMLYLGWKFEFSKNTPVDKLRFVSPEGVIYYSLIEVCRVLTSKLLVESPMPEDDLRIPSLSRKTRSPSLPDEFISSPERKVRKSYSRYSKCNLKALTNYINNLKVAPPNTKARLVAKAREHLVADGWDLDYIYKSSKTGKGKREMRYYSPDGKTFCSLITACIWYKRNIRPVSYAVNPSEERQVVDVRDGLPKHYAKHGNLKNIGIRKAMKRKNAVTGIASRHAKLHKVDFSVLDHGQESGSSTQLAEGPSARCTTRTLRSSKRIRLGASPSHHTPRNVLSLLIENNVIFPREKVHCRGIDGRTIAAGTVTCYGIECCCCECIFSMSKFVDHAAGNCNQPAESIFLEDGRSMLDCQSQLMQKKKSRSSKTKPRKLKGNGNIQKNDYMCSVCHYGGDLVLCDNCPSSFHMDCLDLKMLPEGDWFCPSCCCGICGESSFDRNTENITNRRGHSCSQCERQYHVGCLRAEGLIHTESKLVGEWFCNMQCEKIYQGLHQHLGRPIAVGKDSLTWTLVKYIDAEDGNQLDIYDDSSIETFSKLTIALEVMHECFEPLKEPLTRRDIVEDIIFCKRSNLKRLNFHGFYNVLLEKNDELVSVATIRVHGKKVAEVPLIATRFQYRRHGMCRIVMDGLEKILVQLGVERIILPAAPSVLDTWLTSFGFSKMKKSDRLNFLDYTILDFQGTVMCQKVLKTVHSAILNPVEASVNQSCSDIDKNDEMDLDGNSAVSEVYQADRVEDRELVYHGSTEAAKLGNISENISSPAPPKQSEENLVDIVSDHKAGEDDYNGGIKYYKRRKTSASQCALTIKIGN